MAEPYDSQFSVEERAEAQALRGAIEEARIRAEAEIARLSRRLAERDLGDDSAAMAAEQLALQQETTALRQALNTKEEALEALTAECRRLEDQLEDQHLTSDGLRQELDRCGKSLQDLHSEVARLRDSAAARPATSGSMSGTSLSSAGISIPAVPRSASSRVSSSATINWLLAAVLVTLGSAGGWWLGRSGMDDGASRQPLIQGESAVVLNDTTSPVTTPTPPDSETVAPPVDAPAPIRVERAPVLRDLLRDGSEGPLMARLPGGTFDMGYEALVGEDHGPIRTVRVAPFLIGVHEVTFADYDRFARATGTSMPQDHGWGRGNRPAIGINWYQARDYAAWLARETGRGYRLPSEAEWEYAARAGSRGSFWWGFGMEQGRAVCFDCGSAWDRRSTAPVGSFPANAFGLFDTAGNAMEWVADCYFPSHEGAPSDARPRLDGDCATRVARGGAYNKPALSMRTFVRAQFPPRTHLDMLGFRLARDL